MIYYIFFLLFIVEAFFFNLVRQQLESMHHEIKSTNESSRAWSKLFVVLSAIELILLYSFRAVPDDSQLDLFRYVTFFSTMENGGNSFLEPGFRLYNYICSLLGDSTPYILFTFSFPTISIIMWFIYKHSKNVYLSVFIYYGFMFYFFLFNGLRQCMAMAIGMVAYHFITYKKWVNAAFFILLAATFHSSALILIGLFAIRLIRLKINLRYFLSLTIICCIFAVVGKYLVVPVTMMIAKGYSNYFMMNGYGDEGNIANPIIYLLIMGIIVFFCHGCNEEEKFYINTLSFGIMLYALSIQVHVLNRLAYYFTIIVICILPNILNQIHDMNLKLWSTVGCYVAITIYGVILILNNAHGILPYELGI